MITDPTPAPARRTRAEYPLIALAPLLTVLFAIILAAAAPSATALVDLLNPADGNMTNATTTSFDYYASMDGMTNCSITVNGNSFADLDAQSNTINNIVIQAMTPGTYLWNATCTDGIRQETSASRRFTIDNQPPTLIVMTPASGSTVQTLAVDFVPYDETAATLACTIAWNGAVLETVTVAANTHYARNYTPPPGNGTLRVACADNAGNTATQERTLRYIPTFGIRLATDHQNYGIDEPVLLTVETLSGANVTLDVCPDQSGFVQCTTALLGSNEYPQTFTLPYMNKTGSYLVEGTANFGGQIRINRTRYNITNSISVRISESEPPRLNDTFRLSAVASSGAPPYRVAWQLSNGTAITDATIVDMIHLSPGTFTQRVTVTDAANNTRQANYTYTIEALVPITMRAIDSKTGQPIFGAEMSLEGGGRSVGVVKTGTDGNAYQNVEPGEYTLFASAPGYSYGLIQIEVDPTSNPVFSVALAQDAAKPVVTIIAPAQSSTVVSPTAVQFRVQYQGTAACTLYTSADGSWFSPNATMNVSDAGDKTIYAAFDTGARTIRVDCADPSVRTRTGASPVVSFTVVDGAQGVPAAQNGVPATTASTAPTSEEVRLQQAIDTIDALLQEMGAYGQTEKEAVALLGYDRQLRNAKRATQQAVRDINDLQYRQEFDEAGRAAERKRIVANIDTTLAQTPRGVTVKDTKSFVRYLREEDVTAVAKELAGLGGLSTDPNAIGRHLLGDQQKFTVSTRMMQVEYLYADGTTKPMTIVSRSFTYAKDLSPDYAIYEIIPKEVAKSAKELVITGKAEVLKDDPVLRFATEPTFTYVIPRRVDTTRVEDIKTVLSRPYAGGGNAITGFAIFGAGDAAGLGTPVVIIIVAIVLAYLAYYFDLFKHAQFLAYRLSKKSKLHYMRVLINDADDNLTAGNYEKASMLYKEIRLTYDTLPVFAKNELYEDISSLLAKMDNYYFNLVMIELDDHMKAGDLNAAIASYEKLTGIYARLGTEQQNKLVTTIAALGRRIGAGVQP